MKIDDTLTNALAGLQSGVDRARFAAKDIARLSVGSKEVRDTIQPLLELHKANQQVAANSKVADVADDVIGSIVDVTV